MLDLDIKIPQMDIHLAAGAFQDYLPIIAEKLGAKLINKTHLDLDNALGKAALIAITYPNGMEVLFMQGVFYEEVRFLSQRQSGKHLVFCAGLHIDSYALYEEERNQVFEQSSDGMMVYNSHFAFEIVAHPHQELMYFNTRVGTQLLKTLKGYLPHQVDQILNPDKAVMYLEDLGIDTRKVVRDLYLKLHLKAPFISLFVSAKATEFLTFALLEIEQSTQNLVKDNLSNSQLHQALHMRDLLLKDLSAAPTIPEISQAVGLSPTLAKNIFKAVFGLPIYQFYQQRRMNEAAKLLQQKKHSVGEVAYLLGYINVSHFGKAFKKSFGLSPKKYSLKYKA